MTYKLAIAVLAVLSAARAAEAAPAGGADAALSWLSSVDRGAYSESWTASGELFRTHVSDADWAARIKPVRGPLGAVTSRKLTSETQTTTLPGAPDGHYDVITFATDFSAKHGAVETVILAAEPSGWKVDGYFIK